MTTTRQFLQSLLAGLASVFWFRGKAPASIGAEISAKPAPKKNPKDTIREYLEEHGFCAAMQIEREIRDSSPWLTLIKQFEWPTGDGHGVPGGVWNRVDDGLFLHNPWEMTEYSYSLQEICLRSPALCLENLHADLFCSENIDKRIRILGEMVRLTMIERRRSEFDRLCENRAGTPLEPVLLEHWKEMSETIHQNGGHSFLSIVASKEMIDRIQGENICWYPKPAIDDTPARWKNGERVAPFLEGQWVNEMNGEHLVSKWVRPENPDYATADSEAIYLVHPDVYHQLNPNPNLRAGTRDYTAENYIGTSKFVMLPHEEDPWGSAGSFVMHVTTASKPMMTKFGGVIIVRRQS